MIDDGSWVTGVLDMIVDPAIDSIKKLLNIDQNSYNKMQDSSTNEEGNGVGENKTQESGSGFNLDGFIREKLSLDASKLDIDLESKSNNFVERKSMSLRKVWRPSKKVVSV